MTDDEEFLGRMTDLVELADRDLITGEELNRIIALARIGAAVQPGAASTDGEGIVRVRNAVLEEAAAIARTVKGGFSANLDEDGPELLRDEDGPWVLNGQIAEAILAARASPAPASKGPTE